MLLALVALALAAEAVRIPAATRARREAEAELIFRGLEYADAIARFRDAGGDAPVLPPDIDALLEDRRDGGMRRHLRRAWPAPPEGDWHPVAGPDGGIGGMRLTIPVPALRRAALPPGVTVETGDGVSVWTFVAAQPDTPN